MLFQDGDGDGLREDQLLLCSGTGGGEREGFAKMLELRRDKRCAATSIASAMPNEMTEKSIMLVVRVPGSGYTRQDGLRTASGICLDSSRHV